MTKQELVTLIHEKTKVDKTTVLNVVESFMRVVKDAVSSDENIYLRGFGTFGTKKRAEKKARHIKAKKSILVPAHYIPSFKPSKTFADRVKKIKVKK